ncbi:MAG TPA: MBL fold metallo-hydrolase [Thermoanaerobaculia bacterium]
MTTPHLALVPLGTNGYFPSHGRQTMAFLVAAPGVALLLDAGSGVARLAEAGPARHLHGVETLEVLLTHYHLDHVVGLSFLPGVVAGLSVRIHAPVAPLVAAGTEALDRLLAPPLFPVRLHRWPLPVEVAPYSGSRLEIAGLSLALRAQKHPGGSVGVRVGDALAYVTDTTLDLATIDFVRGVGTLLHEVWLDDAEAAATDVGASGHSAAGAVAELARAARVGRLCPVHHHPRRDEEALERLIASMAPRAGCPIVRLREGEALPL